MHANDFIAIGLGPFNLSLACLTAPLKEHSALFLERSGEWHPGMLMDRCAAEPLPGRPLLADPTSRFSYLYCKRRGASTPVTCARTSI